MTSTRHRSSRPRRPTRLGVPGYVGLLVGLAAAGVLATSGGAGPAASPPPGAKPPSTFTPTERIDVEEAVSFPYDI